MIRIKQRGVWSWIAIVVILGLPIGLIVVSHKGHSNFCDRSQAAGRAFLHQAGFYSDLYYQEHGIPKPLKIDYQSFVTGPWGLAGKYLLNTNLLNQPQTNSSAIAAIIEERLNNSPGPFFFRPLLRLTGWRPWRLVLYANGTMSFTVPREFNTFDLDGFVSSEDVNAKPAPTQP